MRLGSLTLQRLKIMQGWQTRGACRGEDPELFFPIGTRGPSAEQAQSAKDICSSCPVAVSCLQWALDSGQQHGVFGNMTLEERRTYLAKPSALPPRRPHETAVTNGRIVAQLGNMVRAHTITRRPDYDLVAGAL